MRTDTPRPVRREDYAPYPFRIAHVRLHFVLDPHETRVTNRLTFERVAPGALVLDGDGIEPISIALDDRSLNADEWALEDGRLTLLAPPDRGELTLVTVIDPEANTALEGLYRSSGNYCTQCEAEGFRRITFYPDRPDVLAEFEVWLEADADSCPVLLSNGNLVDRETLDDGRHRARWHDPHPKPCYLFALVAGDLAHIEDRFETRSGREVQLFIYVQRHNIDKCGFAMRSLQAAMRWDEVRYGLEYDLERFSIVAVDDFNMGAMENKGLNIFNSRYVLADAATATDSDFLGVESVVAHEYFHNWTGNRVTCRDWFQLSLKEGLTVFRDQQFSAERHDPAVKRIEDVRLLRAAQFPEDSGPTAHPVRPDQYIEINNFYTLTVYEKGAEVIRMLHTLVGEDAYRRGIDLYFERHDGQAVTCEDFVRAMEDASGVDLGQFRRWYELAGTPVVTLTTIWDAEAGRFTLVARQRCPDTPDQADKPPMHIPIAIGLLDATGKPLPITAERTDGDTILLELREREQRFVFDALAEEPLLSPLRGFTAPIRLEHAVDADVLSKLVAVDRDPFVRWDAAQRLARRAIEACLDDAPTSDALAKRLIDALATVAGDRDLAPALKSEMLVLPSLGTIADERETIDMPAIGAVRERLQRALAERVEAVLKQAAVTVPPGDTDPLGSHAMGLRRFAGVALQLLATLPTSRWLDLAAERYATADNMTDRVAALGVLCHHPSAARDRALAAFHRDWRHDRLVIDKWFALQAMAHHDGVLDDVEALSTHEDFDRRNPNRLRSLIGAFASGNPARFHASDGRGYRLLESFVLELDPLNPQLAARLVTAMLRWRRHVEPSRSAMRASLERMLARERLSPDVYEMVNRALEH